jgi:acyl-CoA reductase-like NAD-dependent aldehyde dehydrogenase
MGGLAEIVHGYTSPSNLDAIVSFTLREPLGVVAAITPWNSPRLLLAYKMMPALAAGNTVVVKPSEVTPNSTLRLGELCQQAGFPPGVVNILAGFGEPTGRALVEHPLVAQIAFTGSTRTGQAIAQVAAGRSARVSLELGGKSANIVFADADLDRAADGVLTGIFAAAGQSCSAGSRILVEESVADEFLAEVARRAAALHLGDPLEATTEVPPLASRAQLARVLGYLELADQENARTIIGGGQPDRADLRDGFFVEPTLLDGLRADSRVVREEIFGPVGAIVRFTTEDDAVRIANDTPFGLGGAIWTESVRRAHRLIPRICAGTVWVNTYRALEYRRPFGGFKQSGSGRELGIDALDEFTEAKSVFIDVS